MFSCCKFSVKFLKPFLKNTYRRLLLYQNCCSKVTYGTAVVKKLAKFRGKQLRQSPFSYRLTVANLLKKLRLRCFLVNFLNISEKAILQNTSGRLLLPLQCFKKFLRTVYNEVQFSKVPHSQFESKDRHQHEYIRDTF